MTMSKNASDKELNGLKAELMNVIRRRIVAEEQKTVWLASYPARAEQAAVQREQRDAYLRAEEARKRQEQNAIDRALFRQRYLQESEEQIPSWSRLRKVWDAESARWNENLKQSMDSLQAKIAAIGSQSAGRVDPRLTKPN